jgi:transcriptional regulator with XRE-family HTH domain
VTDDVAEPGAGHQQQRRAELAAFLRSRRERISPEQAGLAPGTRRRTPGLRREEVAQLAGVGVTWYTWLEQGRQINASTQVLSAVARTLLLDPAEREHLFRLADIPDAASAAGAGRAGCEQVPADVQQILDALVPLPAGVLNERFDLLAWNAAYAALWPTVVGAGPSERNVLWLNFMHAGCCHPYVNRDEQLSTLVAQLRGAYGRHLGEPAWTGFVRRLQARSPHFARLWAEHDVANQATYLKIFRHPAPGARAAGHDHHQPGRARRARYPDGRVHAGRRGHPAGDLQPAARRGHGRPLPLLGCPPAAAVGARAGRARLRRLRHRR